MRQTPLFLALLSGVLCAPPPVGAQLGPSLDPAKAPTQYVHRSWTSDQSLPQNTIHSIAQTPDGFLWLATSGGLARFDGVTFTVFNMANTPGLPSNRLLAVAVDAAGDLWIGTETGELSVQRNGRFHAAGRVGGPVLQILFDESGAPVVTTGNETFRVEDGESASIIRAGGSIAWGGDGKLLVGGSQGLLRVGREEAVRWDSTGWTPVSEDGALPTRSPVPEVLSGIDGTIWTGGPRGVEQFADDALPPRLVVGGVGEPISSIAMDRRGTLWIGTVGGNLMRFSDGRLDRFPESLGPPPISISTLFEDREGNLWVGTTTAGLHQLVDGPVTSFGHAEGIPNQVGPVAEDEDGTLLLGSDCGSLLRYRNGELSEAFPALEELSDRCYKALLFDRSGVLWIGNSEGLTGLAAEGVRRFGDVGTITALLETEAGDLWAGTAGGRLLRLEEGRLVPVDLGRTDAGSINHLTTDPLGNLWVVAGFGVARVGNGTVEWLARSAAGLRHAYLDTGGTLWIASYGEGLLRLQGGQLTRITSAQGLCDDFLSRVLPDDHGRLWFNGNAGISYASRESLDAFAAGRVDRVRCALLGGDDGLRMPEGRPGGARASDGRLWLPNIRGISVVDPTGAARNPVPPVVVVEGIIVEAAIPSRPDSVHLAADVRDIEIRYAAAALRHPKRVRFEYRLEGHDRGWIDAGTRRSAYYTDLDPGRYEFRVRVVNEDGVASLTQATLPIQVAPFFFETLWFRTACILAVLGMGGGWYRLRTRRIHARAEELERRVEGRTSELDAVNRELESLAYSMAHDLRAPLRAIDGFSEILTTEKSDQLDEEGLRLLGVVRENTRFMAMLIEDLLEFSRIGRGDMKRMTCDMEAMVNAVVLDLEHEVPDTTRQISVGPLPKAIGDPVLIGQVWVNLLSNAIKFSSSGEKPGVIEVLGWADGADTVYSVKDNGVGFDMEHADKLFSLFERLHRREEFEGTGVGLAIVKRIVERHGGRIWGEGEVGEGATFWFALPNSAQ